MIQLSQKDGEKKFGARQWALANLALSMLVASLGVSIANVALPTLAVAFTASFQDVQWVILAYLLAMTVLIVSVGRLGDIIGRRRMLLAGIIIFTGASALCGVALTLWMLIAARALQGVGAAVLMALTVAFVRETVPKERTGSAMGLLGTASAIGTALGPTLGGILISGLGWRAIFLIMVLLGIVNFFLARRYLPDADPYTSTTQERFDFLGALLLALMLIAYAFAVTVGGGSFNPLNAVLSLIAIIAGVAFVLVENRVVSPLIQFSTFRNLILSASLIMNMLVSTVMMATLIVGPFYLSYALGLKPALVGAVMSIGPVISALSGVPAGRIVDHLGATFMVIAGLAAMVVGACALSLLPPVLGLAGYIIAIAFLTPGYQMFQAANNTTVMMDVDETQRGATSGLLSLSRNLGLITGASVMGAVFAIASGSTDVAVAGPEAVITGLQITFAVAGGLMVIAFAIGIGGRALATRTVAFQDPL